VLAARCHCEALAPVSNRYCRIFGSREEKTAQEKRETCLPSVLARLPLRLG
jgi:hypothetical protein